MTNAFTLKAHPQRLEPHARTCEYLSRWASANIREVRLIRLHLTKLLDRSTTNVDTHAEEKEEGRNSNADFGLLDMEESIRKIKSVSLTSIKRIQSMLYDARLLLSVFFRSALETLDKQTAKLKKQLDGRSVLPYNLVIPLDQMDVQMENGDALRRVDWLVGRNEACRWLRRTNHRTQAIQLSLASCGRFMRLVY